MTGTGGSSAKGSLDRDVHATGDELAPGTQAGAVGASRAAPVATPVGSAVAQFGALVATIAGVFLAPYLRDRSVLPFGWDTLGYIWRTEFVHALGIGQLTVAATHQPKPLGYRPLYLVVSAAIEGATGERALILAWVLPAVLAIALGLTIYAFVVDATELSPWWGVPVGIGVAASPFVAVTGSYATNLAAEVLVFACATLVVREVRGRGGRGTRVGIAMLIAASILTHWMFALLGVGLLAVYAGLMMLTRWVPSRGEPLAALRALGIGLAAGVVGFALAPERPGGLPRVEQLNALIIGSRRLPDIPLAAMLVLAAVSVAVILLAKHRPFDAVVPLLLCWIAVLPAGFFAWYVLHLPLPPYRTAAFVIALPLLVLLVGPALAMRLRRLGGRGIAIGAGVTVVLAAWLAFAGADVWAKRALTPASDPQVFAQVGTVGSYLEGLGSPRRVVFVTSKRTPLGAIAYEIAAALPPEWVPGIAVERVRAPLTEAPVEGAPTLYLTAYNRETAPPGGQALGPGVFLIEGPSPSVPVSPGVPPRAPSAPSLIAITLACLSLLGLAGSGWSFGFLNGSTLARVGLAPVIGLAVIGLVGLVSSRLGLGLGLGVGSWVIVAVATTGGWVFRNRSAAPIREQRRLDGHP